MNDKNITFLPRGLIERILKRTYMALAHPGEIDMGEAVLVDGYAARSPEDSDLWLTLIFKADEISNEFAARLYFIRAGGTRLVPDERWGYVMVPVITDGTVVGWDSREQYERERECLMIYKDELVKLLRWLAATEIYVQCTGEDEAHDSKASEA